MPNSWPSENLYNILTIAEDIHLRFCCMLQSKEGLAELSTVDVYECFSLHASLFGWVIMISDMKPNPFHSYFYLIYRKGLRWFFSMAICMRCLATITVNPDIPSPLVVNILSNSKRHPCPPLKWVWISRYVWKFCIWLIAGFPPGYPQPNGSQAFSNRLFHYPK